MTHGHELAAVVFDLGGVLIDWDPDYLYRKLIPDLDERAAFLASVCTTEWNHTMDAGKPVSLAVGELSLAHPDHADLINAWWERWPEMLRGEHADTLQVAYELADSGLSLYALTNWATDTWPHAMERFPFLATLFRGIVVSGREGIAKPDPRIFHVLERRYDLEPARTAFIDDSAANVSTATSLGYHAHRYTSSEHLRRWLAGLPLPPPR